MKSELNTLQKLNPTKKTIKPLNEKKNSIITQPILKKQKSKTNLTLNDNSQLSSSNIHKMASPKTLNMPSSILSPKTQGNEDMFKSQKSDLKKTGITNTKIKKTGVLKHEPIKKQFLPTIKSPKNAKISMVQSQIYLSSQRDHSVNFNEESNLNIDLDTSILKTEHQGDEIVENQLSFDQSLRKNVSQIQESKIEELSKTSKQQTQQIIKLKQKNDELQRKLHKLKLSQQQNRKKLRDRISTFNEEGQQIKALKQKVIELQKENSLLQAENFQLKNSINISSQQKCIQEIRIQVKNINKKSMFNLQHISHILKLQINPVISKSTTNFKSLMIDQSVMTSFQDSICDGVLSFINGSGSGNFEESILSNDKIKDSQADSYNVIPILQIQGIKNSYEEKYRDKIISLQSFYKEGIKDITNRFELLISQTSQIVKNQQNQIISLQNKIDSLYEKLEDCTCNSIKKQGPNIQTNDEKLKHMMQINQYRTKLSKKDEQLKQYREQAHLKQIQCKKVLSQLDIERIKFNLDSSIGTINKNIVQLSQNKQFQLIMQELKQQKQKNMKLLSQNQKKQELIKKMSANHTSTGTGVNKKLRK